MPCFLQVRVFFMCLIKQHSVQSVGQQMYNSTLTALTIVYDSWTQSRFLDTVRLLIKKKRFRKPALLPSSGEEAPNLVEP